MDERQGILIVDDDRDACETLAAALDQAGFGVETATDPFDALAKAATFVPDLLLTDVRMPHMNGMELIRRLRGSGRRVPAVLMTGGETGDLCTGAPAYGAAACLVKPFALDELIWTIECALACRTLTRMSRAALRL